MPSPGINIKIYDVKPYTEQNVKLGVCWPHAKVAHLFGTGVVSPSEQKNFNDVLSPYGRKPECYPIEEISPKIQNKYLREMTQNTDFHYMKGLKARSHDGQELVNAMGYYALNDKVSYHRHEFLSKKEIKAILDEYGPYLSFEYDEVSPTHYGGGHATTVIGYIEDGDNFILVKISNREYYFHSYETHTKYKKIAKENYLKRRRDALISRKQSISMFRRLGAAQDTMDELLKGFKDEVKMSDKTILYYLQPLLHKDQTKPRLKNLATLFADEKFADSFYDCMFKMKMGELDDMQKTLTKFKQKLVVNGLNSKSISQSLVDKYEKGAQQRFDDMFNMEKFSDDFMDESFFDEFDIDDDTLNSQKKLKGSNAKSFLKNTSEVIKNPLKSMGIGVVGETVFGSADAGDVLADLYTDGVKPLQECHGSWRQFFTTMRAALSETIRSSLSWCKGSLKSLNIVIRNSSAKARAGFVVFCMQVYTARGVINLYLRSAFTWLARAFGAIIGCKTIIFCAAGLLIYGFRNEIIEVCSSIHEFIFGPTHLHQPSYAKYVWVDAKPQINCMESRPYQASLNIKKSYFNRLRSHVIFNRLYNRNPNEYDKTDQKRLLLILKSIETNKTLHKRSDVDSNLPFLW